MRCSARCAMLYSYLQSQTQNSTRLLVAEPAQVNVTPRRRLASSSPRAKCKSAAPALRAFRPFQADLLSRYTRPQSSGHATGVC
jgi:hypothetical protein